MKIFITGGCGYIGSNLVRMLKEEGFGIVVLDKCLFSWDMEVEGVEYIKFDLKSRERWYDKMGECDAVVHLAGIVGDPACLLDPKLAIETNVEGTKIICEAAKEQGKKFIHISSCSIYGAQSAKNKMLSEKSKTIPIDFYGFLKEAQERIVKQYFGKKALIYRLGTAYGLNEVAMRFDLVVNSFIAKAMNHEQITVFGGNQQRPFVHIKDVARAIIHGLQRDLKGIFNVAGENKSIVELANNLTDNVLIEERVIDKRNYIVSSNRLTNTGFEFKYKIKDAFAEMENSQIVNDYKNEKYYRHLQLKKVLEAKQ